MLSISLLQKFQQTPRFFSWANTRLLHHFSRQDVISCLRLNDRKPLDCWKEVEAFKREVRKLEENYVSSVL